MIGNAERLESLRRPKKKLPVLREGIRSRCPVSSRTPDLGGLRQVASGLRQVVSSWAQPHYPTLYLPVRVRKLKKSPVRVRIAEESVM